MSTSDLHARAAHFFLFAEQASRLDWWPYTTFWKMFTSSTVEATAHLPALAAVVRKTYYTDVLWGLARHPLPDVLSPEAVPWHDHLVASWEVHRASDDPERQGASRLALVRLDGCGMPTGMQRPSRLPEWLAEARKIVGAGCEPARTEPARTEPARTGQWRVASGMKLEALAALADWRPAPGVITPPETLREWVGFWRQTLQSRSPLLKGIAAKALLNLPETHLRAASIRPVPPEQRLRGLARAIPAAAEITTRSETHNYLLLLDWHPEEPTALPAVGVAEVAGGWLEVASHKDLWCREMAWQQLIRWDRAGSLAPCGMNLLPRLVRAAQTEKNEFVLWQMAQWRPVPERFTGTEKPDRLDLLRQLETAWQRHRQSCDCLTRVSGWLAGIHLHQAGLASESPDSFREAYMSAVAQEHDRAVLFVLAQWAPGAEAPAALHRQWRQVWQVLLGDADKQEVAAFALLRQALEKGAGDELRRLALEVWRTATKAAAVTGQLSSVPFRFHGVRAHLSTGGVPDFEEEPAPPAQRQYPRLALPPGHITDREWRIENEKLKMENHEGALGPANRPAPDGPSR